MERFGSFRLAEHVVVQLAQRAPPELEPLLIVEVAGFDRGRVRGGERAVLPGALGDVGQAIPQSRS